MSGHIHSPEEGVHRAVYLGTQSPAGGINPQVGCVITDASGRVTAEGFHHGAGTPHAEVEALAAARSAGLSVQGATAYVSLEPCAHTGRTGPCAVALIEAGVARVFYGYRDPNPLAKGGAELLKEAGVAAEYVPSAEAASLVKYWAFAVANGRPYVIAKWAQTLDGYTAASDGSSFWITGEEAREHVHQQRAIHGAIAVGTHTVKVDNPQLSARPGGVDSPHQPLRVVVGHSKNTDAQIWRDSNVVQVATHDPAEVLAELNNREIRSVIVEGGATVISAFLRAQLVDECHVYVAPALLGAGTRSVADLGISQMEDALRGEDVHRLTLGNDTFISFVPSMKGV